MSVHVVVLAHNTLVCAIFMAFPTGNVSLQNKHIDVAAPCDDDVEVVGMGTEQQ